jgi:hypothetical protein
MHKKNKRPPCRKIVLKLPDLDHAKSAVLNSPSSPHSRRNYKFAMEQFITWHCSKPRLVFEPDRCPAISPWNLWPWQLELSISALLQPGDKRIKPQIPACSVWSSLQAFAGSRVPSSLEPAQETG